MAENLAGGIMDIEPSGIDLGRARTLYNVARIHAKIVYRRDHSKELWLESHEAAAAPSASTAPPTVHLV